MSCIALLLFHASQYCVQNSYIHDGDNNDDYLNNDARGNSSEVIDAWFMHWQEL